MDKPESEAEFVERMWDGLSDIRRKDDYWKRLFALARRGAASEFLFGLLDDIDTADDMAKSNETVYREMVRNIHRRRFEVASTDGYTVTFLPPPPKGETE